MAGELLPNPFVGDIQPWNEKKKFEADIQHILLQFEKPKEWADLMNCLIRLHRRIKHSSIREIPQKETICKRLAQCLNPQLPSGVHARALDVYESILEKTGSDGLAQNLALFSSGLFPFFTYSSSSVKPIFLNLIEQYYLPLGKKLLPCLIGLLICILPGLDDDKSESYEQVYKVLERISDGVSERNFMRALWLILLNASRIRLSTLMVIANKLAPGLPKLPLERVDILVPHRHVLVMKSLEATTEDDSLLVLREMINMLIKHFPFDSNILTEADKSTLCRHCLKLLTKRNWSLNRRLYHWIFNATNDFNTASESLNLTYFTKYSKDNLITAIKDLLMERGKTLDEVLVPIKIVVTFISDSDLRGVTDKLMPALCIPILKYICKEREEEEWRSNIIETARLIFDTSITPTSIIFESIVNEYNEMAASDKANSKSVWIGMLELSSVYLDEVSNDLKLADVLCGLLMLMNNALDHLHTLKINENVKLINNIIMYVSTILARVEAIIRGEGNFTQLYDNIELDEEENSMMSLLVKYQQSCNANISRYLDTFYNDALIHFEANAAEISAYEFQTIDVLNDLVVRFVAVEAYMQIIPLTKGLVPEDLFTRQMDGANIDDLNETYIPERASIASSTLDSVRLTSLFRTDSVFSASSLMPSSYRPTVKNQSADNFKLENWMHTLLKCTISSNAQLFCRGIRMFIELLRLPNKADLYIYVEENGVHLNNIIARLWNSLDDIHAASHSEIVLLLIQLNKIMPLSQERAEEIIVKDLTAPETDMKVTAMLRFGVLWRYGYIHAPVEELFPQAVGCILDNVEESDPKLRYYSCSFLSESVAILPNLINPILRALVSFDKIDPESYSSNILEVLRKFRHLSYMVSREGPVLLDLMQKCQAPPKLIELVQGRETYAKMLSATSPHIETQEQNKQNRMNMAYHTSLTLRSLNPGSPISTPLVTFPKISDPQGISYEDTCIYDYVDLIVILTLKYICLDIDVSTLLKFTTVDHIMEYTNPKQRANDEGAHAVHEDTMLFRCTAIDFMKLFLSTIQPTQRAKEVACLISRPLLCVLYDFHLNDETIIQTQLLYLLKVVLDRCHVESQTNNEMTHLNKDSNGELNKHGAVNSKQKPKVNESKILAQKLKELGVEQDDLMSSEKFDEPDENNASPTKENISWLRSGVNLHRDAAPLQNDAAIAHDFNIGDHFGSQRKDAFNKKIFILPRSYILNVVMIKMKHVGKLKKLSQDTLFVHILESCILNTAKSRRSKLLQSYIDFCLYTLKYLTGASKVVYSSTFIKCFCDHLSRGKEWIQINTVSQYLRGIFAILGHISGKMGAVKVDLNADRFQNDLMLSSYAPSSLLGLIGKDTPDDASDSTHQQMNVSHSKTKTFTASNEDEDMEFEITKVVDICIQCLLWMKKHDKAKKADNHSKITESTSKVFKMSNSGFSGASNSYEVETASNDSIRLDIIMSLQTIYNEILQGFGLLYKFMPYHFAEGCLVLWDKYEKTNVVREVKVELLSCLSSMPHFSGYKMISYVMDMLEAFAKSQKYKKGRGYQLLNYTVRDNSTCEFIYALSDLPLTMKRDIEGTFEVMQRFVSFVLNNPRQPMVLLWCFQMVCNFDKLHPTKDVNVIGKLMKRMLTDLMNGIIYQSVGLYVNKVCSWLQPKLYDLEAPLPPHIYMINQYYYDHIDPRKSVLSGLGAGTTIQSANVTCINRQKTVDSMDCVCKNAMAQIIVYSYETVQLSRRTAIANVFFHVLWNSLSVYILPMLQEKMDQPLAYRYLILLLLQHLPFDLYEGSLQCIKRFIIDYINAPEFFKMDRRTFRCMIKIFRRVADDACRGTADKLIKLDLFTCPPHSSVFTGRNVNIQSRIKYLNRLAFVLYACRNDAFASHIATIIERLTDNCRAFDDDNLRAKTLLVMRVLLIKMSQKHLTVLWPVLLSELIKVFDRENRALSEMDVSNNSPNVRIGPDTPENRNTEERRNSDGNRYVLLKEALKIIDVAYALGLNDFLIYQWMFVNDLADKDYIENGDQVIDESAFEFKPFIMIVEQTYPEEVKKHLCDDIYLKLRKYIGDAETSQAESDHPSLTDYKRESSLVGALNEQTLATSAQDSTDRRKLISELIDISIEDELMSIDSSLTDVEAAISVHQICKMYRKVT